MCSIVWMILHIVNVKPIEYITRYIYRAYHLTIHVYSFQSLLINYIL